MWFIIASLLSFLLMGVEGDSDCDSDDTHSRCGLLEILVTIRNIEGFPSEEFLRNKCRTIQEAMQCHTEAADRCHDVEDPVFHNAQFQGILALFNAVCDQESALGQGYLENLKCYTSVIEELGDCKIGLNRLLHLFADWRLNTTTSTRIANLKATAEEENEMELQLFCLRLHIIPNCYVRRVADACGSKAALLFSQLHQLYSEPIAELHCTRQKVQMYLDRLMTYMLNNGPEIQTLKDYFS